jgi:heme/copper-type cytochrome/quinol oxidase subunit 2
MIHKILLKHKILHQKRETAELTKEASTIEELILVMMMMMVMMMVVVVVVVVVVVINRIFVCAV